MIDYLHRSLVVFILTLCGAGTAFAAPVSVVETADAIVTKAPRGLLGGPARPLHYTLALTVLPERDRFDGEVSIQVLLDERVEGLYLHGKDLNVTRANVRTADGGRVRASYRQLTDDGIAYIAFGRPVDAQIIYLEFTYDAPFDRKLLGLYRVDDDGRSYAFTQFESIFARKAFVSFDEPQHKTPFDLSLTVHPEHTAIANTEAVATTTTDDGLKRVQFATTEKLPTYLVALAVGELDVVEGPTIEPGGPRKRPLALRGVATYGKGKDLAYALANTGAILAPLEAYFDLPYPYSKLDIIAVPDFQSGAMENAGAITFRERLLLLKPDASVTQRQAFASVMAHELAHMWFGDLVTMPWWDDIWLNESFATWMSYKAIAEFDPGARPELRRLSRLRRAKSEDALQSARQIREPVNDHNDIVAAFDGITYAKGGAVLNMLENYLGEERFRAAVRDHMRRFAWGSADADDFIASLVRASEPAIEPAFKSFLFQNGLPRVRVDKACADGSMTLAQSRFVPLGGERGAAQTWQFPVCARYAVDGEVKSQCEWLRESRATFSFDGGQCPDWMMLDADYSGYYHWAMDEQAYLDLTARDAALSQVEWESVADSIEAGLVDGSLSVGSVWPAMAALARSPYPSVSLAPSRLLEYWLRSFGDEPKLAATLRLRALELYREHNAAQAFDGQFLRSLGRDEDRVFFGELARFMALVARDPDTRGAAMAAVRAALTSAGLDADKLDPLTAQTALTVAAQDADASVRQHILSAFFSSTDAQFRSSALTALGRVGDEKFAQQMRDLTLNGGLRTNEIEQLLSTQFSESPTRPGAWRFISEHYDQLLKVMAPRHAARLAKYAAEFCDEVMRQPMLDLFGPRVASVQGGQRELDKALETMGHCAARVEHERPQVREYFVPGVRR